MTGGTEDPYDELEGGIKLTHASGSQSFSGDIDGEGAVHWLMLYRADKTAHFVGLQRITGSVGGQTGSFVAAAEGDHDGTGSHDQVLDRPGLGHRRAHGHQRRREPGRQGRPERARTSSTTRSTAESFGSPRRSSGPAVSAAFGR